MTTHIEQERLKELFSFNILDTEQEKDLEDLVWLASHICETPISLVSLIDERRQWFKAKVGLGVNETPRDQAFCAHAIKGNDLFIVKNALEDQRFKTNPLVTGDPNIRFYAGMPLTTQNGYNLGTLCVIDREPRELTTTQKNALVILAKQVMNYLNLSRSIQLYEEKNNELREFSRKKEKLSLLLIQEIKDPMNRINNLIELFNDGDLDKDKFLLLLNRLKNQVTDSLKTIDELTL